MKKITPHLWFDKEAKDAAKFYTSVFPESSINYETVLKDTPSGDCDVVSFKLWGQDFMSISAGPLFKFNPSVSFVVNFDPLFFNGSESEATKALDKVWESLSKGGEVLIPIDKYPFSKRYGWIKDKYGVTWQLMLTDPSGDPRPSIIPSIMFTGKNAGRAEEAINYYLGIFKNSAMGTASCYGADQKPDKEGTLMFADFKLEDQWFGAMDSARDHNYNFNEAISLMVNCDTQEEIDHYWQLSADPRAEQCGWLKDKFGLSWQINPSLMDRILRDKDQKKVARVTKAFLKMKKFDLAELEQAYHGEVAV